MITPSAQPPADSAVPPAGAQPSTGPVKVPDEIMSQVARPSGQTAEFRDGNRDGIEDREQGIFRPGELIGYDAQGNEVRSPGTQQPVNRIPASSQTPVDALSSFEQDSLSRQQRIGGTGSFAGDSEARDAKVREMDRRPGESQAGRDTRLANEKVTRSASAEGRAYTDSELRRAFGEDYQEAIIKDRNGINPFTDKTYADEELERQNLIEDTEARKRSNVDDPPESPTKAIEDARAKAEAMAAASGLSPGDPDYEDFILDSIETMTGIPRYRKPPPKYADDAAADAAHAAGDLKVGDSFVMDGEMRVYAGPAPEESVERRRGRRQRR